MKEIIGRLQCLVYGKDKYNNSSESSDYHRNSAVIEDSDSLHNKVKNMKRSCSWRKLMMAESKKNIAAKSRWKSNNFYPDAVYEYNGNDSRNHKSSMMLSSMRRINDSLHPNNYSTWNKSHIKSVKVYNFENTNKKENLHQKLKTSRKTHRISSKMFKKFMKDYQEKVNFIIIWTESIIGTIKL